MKKFTLYCDGASRGNPGPASIGAILLKENQEEPVATVSEAIGTATNNEAEYRSLLAGTRAFLNMVGAELTDSLLQIRMDSELVVKQIKGEYRVKNEKLKSFYTDIKSVLAQIPNWNIQHVRRELNKEADKLANAALDKE